MKSRGPQTDPALHVLLKHANPVLCAEHGVQLYGWAGANLICEKGCDLPVDDMLDICIAITDEDGALFIPFFPSFKREEPMGTKPEIDLNWKEFSSCVDVAMARFKSSSARGDNQASSVKNRSFMTRLEEEVIGTCAELAICKFKGLKWDGSVDTFHSKADVGELIEVRGTVRTEGKLLHRKHEPVDRYYVLVTGNGNKMTIQGWMRGGDCRQERWLRAPNDDRPVYMVPQSELRQDWK